MYIVSKENGVILNFDNIVELYTGNDGTAILAKQLDGKAIRMKEYETKKEANEAIAIISDEMSRKNIVYIPRVDEVRAKLVLEEQKYHHVTGKKTKGHGGS